MTPFLSEDDLASFPPVSAYQRALAAFDTLARAERPQPWFAVRSREDVLVDAKAVDERGRTGDRLPLAGVLVAVFDDAVVRQRLESAGAVVLGTASRHAATTGFTLGAADAVVCRSLPAECHGVVALRPTRGLVPSPGDGQAVVLARDIDVAQRTAAAMTGPEDTDPGCRPWPGSVRFSAGEHPRVAVPAEADLAGLPPSARHAFGVTADALRAAGAAVSPLELSAAIGAWTARPATALRGHDALLMPLAGTSPAFCDLVEALDVAAVAFDDGAPAGAGVLARAFDDQVALDLVALLTGAQADTPYPSGGVELAVTGAYLRGQPLNEELTRLGARCTGFAETAPAYRMVALPGEPPQAGLVHAGRDGVALLTERWLVSPAGLGRFLADLPAPLLLGGIELADGGTVTGVLCDPRAARQGTDISEYGCWRAYLRHRSTFRPQRTAS
ncbi:allophanate hydrolase-related protein [Prauserella muralis]|uniref:Allophanate hydrolase C-terminal domain-containing protein n=1 Tax=Prauserella muralis TaxID=588067 RepID=A0A2V4BEH0_9PSEU|nr:amidase family protein [Prauserella muralis]PXY28019.1 hypothetical protein BAY60_16885 [Prauserella muralis]TWE22189.1 amidase [Prauserella muralis]